MTDMSFLEKPAVHTVIAFILIYVTRARGTLCPYELSKVRSSLLLRTDLRGKLIMILLSPRISADKL